MRSVIKWHLASGLTLLLMLFSVAALHGVARAQTGNGGHSLTDGPAIPDQVVGNQEVRRHFFSKPPSCLRVVTAGVRTRNAPPSPPTTGGVIALPPGPTPGSIVFAALYWTILAGAPPPNAVTLNGVPVAPVALPVTASPCWGEPFAFAYFADVTGIAVPGANVVAGLDDSGVLGFGPESEGASLVVVYRSQRTGACEIIIKDGNDLIGIGTPLAIDEFMPTACPAGSPATLTFIGDDGQTAPSYPFPDDQLWNGVVLGDTDDFDASDPPAPGAAADISWDTDGWGVVTGPPNTAEVSVVAYPALYDCFNWVATVLEVGVFECQAVPTQNNTWGRIKTRYH